MRWIQLRTWDLYRGVVQGNARGVKKGDRVLVTSAWRWRGSRDGRGEEMQCLRFEVQIFEHLKPTVMRVRGLCRVVARTVWARGREGRGVGQGIARTLAEPQERSSRSAGAEVRSPRANRDALLLRHSGAEVH